MAVQRLSKLKLITTVFPLMLSLLFLTAAEVNSEPLPPALKDWQQWVLAKHPQHNCPNRYNSKAKHCLWFGPTRIEVNPKGVKFAFKINNLSNKTQPITLPGSDQQWPTSLRLNGKLASITRVNNHPVIHLMPGLHRLEGRISWSKIPDAIDISPSTGLVELWQNGQRQLTVNRNKDKLWLKAVDKLGKQSQQDHLALRVFRKIADSIPAQIDTRIELTVSGSERQITLGQTLLHGSRATALNSNLPAKLEEDGSLRVLVKPGNWTIEIKSRQLKPLSSLAFKATSQAWPKQEVWSYQAYPQLHRHQLNGGQAVDPGQMGVPKAWANLPALALKPEQLLSFNLEHRGNPNPSANKLSLKKRLWLDFDGQGFTHSDNISGELNQQWRLAIQPENQLGRATLNGQAQLITELENGQIGLQVHQREVRVNAISRSAKGHWLAPVLKTSGWQHKFNAVQSQLQLPPGWALLHASGVDEVDVSWVSQWTLLDLFLLLIISASVLRLAGPIPAITALLTLALLFHRDNAPVYIWLNIIGVMALLGVMKGKVVAWLEASLKRYFWFSCGLLLLIWLPFAVEQIRTAIYPQLEYRHHRVADLDKAPEAGVITSTRNTQAPEQLSSEAQATIEQLEESQPSDFDDLSTQAGAPAQLSKPRRSKRLGAALSSHADKRQQLDPGRRVQTGPGEPKWRWNSIGLRWQGPVSQEQSMTLYLASPWMNALANILAALSPLLLALLLFKPMLRPLMPERLSKASTATAATWLLPALVAVASFGHSPSNMAQTPSPKLLAELERRLTKPLACLPDCSSVQQLELKLSDKQLQLDMQLNASGAIAWPLPVPASGWQPNRIQLDGKPAASYRQGKQWLIMLSAGIHQLNIQADISQVDKLSIDFSDMAHNLTVQAPGWSLVGAKLPEHNLEHAKSLSFSRLNKQQANRQQVLQTGPMPAFARINRYVRLGIDWQMESEIHRLSRGNAIHIELPLLPGESLSDSRLKVIDGKIHIRLEPEQQRLRWRSSIKKAAELELSTPVQDIWLERWRLQADNRWRLSQPERDTPQLLPSGQAWVPQWRPWPGENVKLIITEPKAVEGSYLSFEQVSLTQQVGQRSQNVKLSFKALSSQGQAYSLDLPTGAELQNVSVNGRSIPLGEDKTKLSVDLLPGSQWLEANWQQSQTLGSKVSSPALTLGALSSNNVIKIQLPRDRWPLLVGGPQMGPAVLIWGYMLVISIVAIVLGRYGGTPIKTYEWLLLGIGIGFNQLFAPILIAAWLLILAWRGRWQKEPSNGAFAASQILLFSLSFLSMLVLIFTITNSLLARPDMHITGNGSYAYSLVWFADRAKELYPQAWVISLPLWGYRLAMLLWSLWLAFAVLRWLKWGWAQINHLGLWYKQEPTKPKASPKKTAVDSET